MSSNSSTNASANSTSFLQIVADKTNELIVKVFDVKGKRAKTFNATDLEGQDVFLNLMDLETGKYILNAFSGGNFIKPIQYVKQ